MGREMGNLFAEGAKDVHVGSGSVYSNLRHNVPLLVSFSANSRDPCAFVSPSVLCNLTHLSHTGEHGVGDDVALGRKNITTPHLSNITYITRCAEIGKGI
jgi:hypothetical protein